MPKYATRAALPYAVPSFTLPALPRGGGSKQYLEDLVKIVRTQSSEVPRHNNPRTGVKTAQDETPLSDGWYEWGFFPGGVYSAKNLVHVYYALFRRYFPDIDPPKVDWYLFRPGSSPLLSWLQSCGHEHCQQIIEFTFREWGTVKFDLQSDTEVPLLNQIYGYRHMLARLCAEHDQPRTWGANVSDWNEGGSDVQKGLAVSVS